MARDTTLCPVCCETITWPEESCLSCEAAREAQEERTRLAALKRARKSRKEDR